MIPLSGAGDNDAPIEHGLRTVERRLIHELAPLPEASKRWLSFSVPFQQPVWELEHVRTETERYERRPL
jgi:hypothetical protein